MKLTRLVSVALVSLGLVNAPSIAVSAQAPSTPLPGPSDPHAGHEPPKPSEKPARAPESPSDLPSFVPSLTNEDRAAAFPDLEGHTVHDQAIHYFLLADQLEWQAFDDDSSINVDSKGWIGRDRDRVWFRTEGDYEDGAIAEAQAHVLYGRQISRWWDVVGGIRQDFQPSPSQTWAAIGIQGLAPYWFEVEATAYVGAGGRTQLRFEIEYELLLTNRLIVQPLLEAEILGKSDRERGLDAGLSTTDAGFRVRYEFKRQLAPYIGITWNRRWGTTAHFARTGGDGRKAMRLMTGLRMWF